VLRSGGSIAIFFTLALSSALAAADPAPGGDRFDSFNAGVNVAFGLGAPLGAIGAEGELDFGPHAYLTAGAGLGKGLQVGAMAHLRTIIGSRRVAALSAGYGLSYGNHHWSEFFCFESDCAEKEGYVYWHNAEVSLEVRQPPQPGTVALIARGFLGVAVAGNRENLRCVTSIQHCEEAHTDDGGGPLPYLGGSVGFLFR
jgi:hypothetical protein